MRFCESECTFNRFQPIMADLMFDPSQSAGSGAGVFQSSFFMENSVTVQ